MAANTKKAQKKSSERTVVLRDNALNIFADGSSLPRPRRGGIGIRFVTTNALGDEVIEDHYLPGYKGATNNQMELMACIKALDIACAAFFDLEAASILHKSKRLERQAIIDEVEKSLEGKETAKSTHPARIAFQERVEKRMRELEAEEQRMASSPSNTKD